MSVAAFRSDPALDALQGIRVSGGVAMTLASDARGTHALRVAEADGHRVRFPPVTRGCEGLLLNTGGGIAGGDFVRWQLDALDGAEATVTSVAAERVYRAAAEPSRLAVSLTLGPRSRIAWVPQETILYSGARLVRRFEADLAVDSELTILDILVLGRRGSGERMIDGMIDDKWSIRRNGRLVHMEATRLSGDIDDVMQRPANGDGAHVVATILHVGPGAADRLERVRASIGYAADIEVAASAWNGKLVIRALGARGGAIRSLLAVVAGAIIGRPLPRVWQG